MKYILESITIADVVSLINAISGAFSILFLVQGNLNASMIMILVSVIADAVDGRIARCQGCGVLGEQLDSLSDIISFGVAPSIASIIVLKDIGILAGISGFIFLISGILRLARFNISHKGDFFQGLPITAAGMLVALFILIRNMIPYSELIFFFFIIFISYLMISTITYQKLKSPYILSPMALFMILDILFFILNNETIVELSSGVLFILTIFYVISPLRTS